MAVISGITVELTNLDIDRKFNQALAEISRQEGQELTQTLTRDSPRGVSPTSEALADNWEFRPFPAAEGTDLLNVSNEVPNAFEKLAGSPQGNRPDSFPGSLLDRWVRRIFRVSDDSLARLITARVASKIEREGTDRWQTGQNILDVDPNTGELRRSSIVFETARRIEERIEDIEIEG